MVSNPKDVGDTTTGGQAAGRSMKFGGQAAGRNMKIGGQAAGHHMKIGAQDAGRDMKIGDQRADGDLTIDKQHAGRDLTIGCQPARSILDVFLEMGVEAKNTAKALAGVVTVLEGAGWRTCSIAVIIVITIIKAAGF